MGNTKQLFLVMTFHLGIEVDREEFLFCLVRLLARMVVYLVYRYNPYVKVAI